MKTFYTCSLKLLGPLINDLDLTMTFLLALILQFPFNTVLFIVENRIPSSNVTDMEFKPGLMACATKVRGGVELFKAWAD